ncbi:unnamed protein product [Mytilus edulis]|uniref:IgGFc-binding protein N-terminal domain-containing protein n=1 Tax=Mytilus edulis TaxID=6550 RepID=A0A8S3UM46_MYTED|nr:unnamed protein product [Mytilus edulis]
MTSVGTFGKQFVTMNMPNCNVPVDFKIVASSSNTYININGRGAVHLATAGDVHAFQVTDQTSRTIMADKPIALAFFAEGGCGSDQGDPAMILLPPIEQFAADYTFSTIKTPGNPFQNALTVVIPSTEVNGLSLDGHLMTSYHWQQNCSISKTVPGDIVDNDCDGLIDEELLDGTDNDGDGKIDEDLAVYFNG